MSSNDFFSPAFSFAFVSGDSAEHRDALFSLPRAWGSVPALLRPGADFKVTHVDSSAFGAVYMLECIEGGECVSIEISTRGMQRGAAAIGARVAVTSNGLGRVLVCAGEAIAFVPNAIGRALLDAQAVPA